MFPFSELKDMFIMICSNKFISFCSVFIVIMVFNGYLFSAMFGTDELAENTKFQESSNHLVHLDQMNLQNLPLNDSSYRLNRELSSLNNNGTYEINKTSKHGEISNTEAINGKMVCVLYDIAEAVSKQRYVFRPVWSFKWLRLL